MPLRHVSQSHHNGCFTACVAMLLGKTYDEVFKTLYPRNSPLETDPPGLQSNDIVRSAIKVLSKFGVKVRKSKYKNIKSLIKYSHKNALLIIRWPWDGGDDAPTEEMPWLCHAVVFDAETKQFLDPHTKQVNLRRLQRHLDCMFYVDLQETKPTQGDIHEQGRIQQASGRRASVAERACDGSQQVHRIPDACCTQ